ncbi:MAG TPA: hypothetical protein VNJ07_13595 [Chitinophagales bacterium]|nr:hypothetical protein [Chitinophagales bacterium]
MFLILFVFAFFLFVSVRNASLDEEEEKFSLFLDSLNQASDSDFGKLNEIRNYLAQRIDLGNTKSKLKNEYYNMPWDSFSPYQCITLFKENKLTANCGITSYALAKLYAEAGYKTYVYNCGYAGTPFTHEFNLVEMQGKLILQDAYYNLTAVDSTGEPKDFLQFLSEIRQCNYHNIFIRSDEILTENWMDTVPELDYEILCNADFPEWYKKHIVKMEITANRLKILVKRNYHYFTQPFSQRLRLKLQEDGLCENYLSLYLKPLHVKDANTGFSAETLKKRILGVVN